VLRPGGSPTALTRIVRMDRAVTPSAASKLIGLDVYNEAHEKLGDINELILDKDGTVSAVVIGVSAVSLAVPVVNQIRTYWWCSPPRIGRPRMCPASSGAREIGASFSKDKCVRISL
jgi:hypothetical protein